jgi:hypothetical protein
MLALGSAAVAGCAAMFPREIMRERDAERDDELIALQGVPILQRLCMFRFSEQQFRPATALSRAS